MTPRDPTRRFADRVQHYVRSRPGYPVAVLDLLVERCGLRRDHRVADLGSGTGKLSMLFLEHGNPVVGVEPNREMRQAAERLLARFPGFTSRDGRAEATGLPAGSVDVVAAGQAFHWFDPERSRAEALRILRGDGLAVLVWNDRSTGSSAFMGAYEKLLEEFGTDYAEVDHQRMDGAAIARFFGAPGHARHQLPNVQEFDLPTLRARLLSSSYVPASGPCHAAMLERLAELFAAHQVDGRVRFVYDTRVFFGRPAGETPGARRR